MNTFSDLNSWHRFSISFILKELIKDSFKFINQSYFLEIFFKFIDSHCSYWNYFLFIRGYCIFSCILVIFTVVHSIESLEELSKFVTNMIKTEDKDLEMWPDLVESWDKIMWIFCHFLDGSESRLNVMMYKFLNIFSDEPVNSYFVCCCWFFCRKIEDKSK